MKNSIVKVLYKPVEFEESTHFFCLSSDFLQDTSTAKSLEGYQEVNLTLAYLSLQILMNTMQLMNALLQKTGDKLGILFSGQLTNFLFVFFKTIYEESSTSTAVSS